MKTAMQDLIDRLNNDELLPNNWQEKYLDKEKKQITDAFIDGDSSIFIDSIEDSADNYYNSKFKQ